MIKKQQKWIALLVVCTFLWLMQVSTMPMAAAGTSGQTGVASAEQGPDYYEAIGQKAAPAKKKSILPLILIGVGVVAITAVLFLVVFKTNYDITGSWHIILTGTGGGAPSKDYDPCTFTGDKKTGTFQIETYYDGMGTYSVDGKTVTLRNTHANYPGWVWTGEFTDKTHISGTSTWQTWTWSWTATKNATAATVNPDVKETQSKKPVLE